MKTVTSSILICLCSLPLQGEDVTYHRDIAPIIHANCMSCHRPGESAPFPLTNYEEVSRKAKTIARVVDDRYMPPWHANHEVTAFQDVRRLSDDEVALIGRWVDEGKAEGDPADSPEPPSYTEGWQLGEPDMIVTMAMPYDVPADGPDIYRNFVLPLDLDEDKWVKAIELRPSARSVVHHSLYFLDDSGTARKLDGQDGKPGFRGMSFRKSGSLGGYVPGVSAKKLPGDLARPLPKGSDLVLSTHFHPSGKAEVEQTTVGIYFADQAPARQLQEVQVPPGFGRGMGIDIPAGETNYVVEDSFKLPVDVEAISVSGHAHYICETMRMTASLPDGTEKILLDIPDWDLDWQDTYYFASPTFLPAGTVLTSVITYDNSSANPDNPHTPPQRIKWGRESTDEMGSITLIGVPVEADDYTSLNRSTQVQKAKIFAQLGKELKNTRVLDRLPVIIRALDKNQDGSLQEEELPARLRGALLLRLDGDENKVLDPSEIQTLKDWLESMKSDNNA
ncbi:cytochrome c [Verrucomicrobiales bacterium BCK34]|nr:cytochrome c [Verrucomicrobiales bacterium BCK34]